MNELHILAIGDSHIPRRAKEVPEPIIQRLIDLAQPQLFDYTLFTGDIVKKTDFLEFLQSKTKKDFHIVEGNMDRYSSKGNVSVYKSLRLSSDKSEESLVIGLTHGFQIEPRGDHSQLETLANKKNYNILISGHTHKEEVHLTNNGILLLNPGSVIGAWSFVASEIPSFITLKTSSDNSINVNLFRLDKRTDKIDVSKSYFIFKDDVVKSKY
jgi:putative phosphoesterase